MPDAATLLSLLMLRVDAIFRRHAVYFRQRHAILPPIFFVTLTLLPRFTPRRRQPLRAIFRCLRRFSPIFSLPMRHDAAASERCLHIATLLTPLPLADAIFTSDIRFRLCRR